MNYNLIIIEGILVMVVMWLLYKDHKIKNIDKQYSTSIAMYILILIIMAMLPFALDETLLSQ